MIEKPKPEYKCGLCGKNNQEAYLANGIGLTLTKCCWNWVCDDTQLYVPHSFLENSCERNHTRYTICGSHHSENHTGNWKNCQKCRTEIEKITYDHQSTNKYNFVTLKNVKKDEIWCRNCGFTSFDLSEFSHSTSCGEKDRNFYCRKPACRRKGGFDIYNFDKNATFMNSMFNPKFAKENEQRLLSFARSGDGSLQFESDDVQELTTQANKMLKKVTKNLRL